MSEAIPCAAASVPATETHGRQIITISRTARFIFEVEKRRKEEKVAMKEAVATGAIEEQFLVGKAAVEEEAAEGGFRKTAIADNAAGHKVAAKREDAANVAAEKGDTRQAEKAALPKECAKEMAAEMVAAIRAVVGLPVVVRPASMGAVEAIPPKAAATGTDGLSAAHDAPADTAEEPVTRINSRRKASSGRR